MKTGSGRPKAASGLALALALSLGSAAPAAAQTKESDLDFHFPDWKTVAITDHDLGHGLHMLESFGGNVGVLETADGILVTDSEYPELTDRIVRLIRQSSDKPIRFVIVTHYHWDHSGGARNFAALGATVMASAETRRHMIERQAEQSGPKGQFPRDPAILPVVTLGDHSAFHLGGQTVEVEHLPPTHTDGDLLVFYKDADVIQTGDAFFKGFYPYIDVKAGGGIDGMIALCDRLYALAGPATRIIPGHGVIATKADAQSYGRMLRTIRTRVAAAIAAGKSIDQLIAEKPLADLDPDYGGNLIKADTILRIVYEDLHRRHG